ncbi:MAG: hypothetical protein R3E13_00200 [Alphaproteobacteria bacterium]
MAEAALITPLNFNDTLIGKLLNDKKAGLDIIPGHISGLPPRLAVMAETYGHLCLALINRGMGQQELDMACGKLAGDCLSEDFDILITKSDLPFDSRWYIAGDLDALLEAARQDRMSLPFSDFMYDELQQILNRHVR